MFIKKSIQLGTTLLAIGTPMTMVLSCGKVEDNSKKFDSYNRSEISAQQLADEKAAGDVSNTEISLAVGSDDVSLFQSIVAEFNKLGKGKINTTINGWSGSPKDSLSTVAGTGAIPTVFINDLNVQPIVRKQGLYAKPIVLDDFLGTTNKDLYNTKDTDVDFSESKINADHLRLYQNSSQTSFGLPIGFGSSSLIVNAKMLDKDIATPQIDIDYDIYDYVPTTERTTNLEKVWGVKRVGETSTKVQSMRDIEAYIQKAGNSNEVENGDWLGKGPGSMFQRIYSVGFSILTNHGQKTTSAAIMPFKENLINFGILATSGQKVLDNENVMQQDLFETELSKINNSQESKLLDYYWKSITGYMSTGNDNQPGFITTDYLNRNVGQGEAEPFTHGQALFQFNPKWAARWAETGWSSNTATDRKNNKFFNSTTNPNGVWTPSKNPLVDGEMQILAAPYTDVNTATALSIANNAGVKETLVAKRFLKFILQRHTDVSFVDKGVTVTKSIGDSLVNKFIASFEHLNNAQKDEASEFEQAWFGVGKNDQNASSVTYEGVGGTVWKMADTNFMSIVEGQLIPKLQSFHGTKAVSPNMWTYEEYKTLMAEFAKKYFEQKEMVD